jgi:sugar lactone lactonase YvrE
MYWTTSQTPIVAGGGRIQRANLDGSGVEDLVAVNLTHPVGIALDTLHGKMYWTDLKGNFDGMGAILRSNLDGSNVETLITGIDEANGLALDAVGGQLYWPELTTGKIQRANLDGSGIEDLVVGLDTPTTIGLDLSEGTMYWTDSGSWPIGGQINRIQRANLDGSNMEVIVSGVGYPWGIAVIPEPSTALLLSAAGLLALLRRRGMC